MGFDGKTLIHPLTVETANEAFSPSAPELEFARKVVEAAEAESSGVVVVDGNVSAMMRSVKSVHP
jgi:citrate lyase subunit beta / citryl-CoA lyase